MQRFSFQQGAGLATLVMQDILTLCTTSNFGQFTAVASTAIDIPQLRRARLLLELGRNPEAEAALRAYLESPLTGSDPQFINEAAWCLRAFGSPAERERVTADLLRKYPDTYASGVILLMQGREEKAWPLLEKCPPIFLQSLYWEPVFDPVRGTPRFRQLLEKLGCAEQYRVARAAQARLVQDGIDKP